MPCQAPLLDTRPRNRHRLAIHSDCRDDALAELANAYADIDAMQATLADSALYVRQLRQRVAELEVWQQRQHQQQQAAKQQHVPAADGHKDKDQGIRVLSIGCAGFIAALATCTRVRTATFEIPARAAPL